MLNGMPIILYYKNKKMLIERKKFIRKLLMHGYIASEQNTVSKVLSNSVFTRGIFIFDDGTARFFARKHMHRASPQTPPTDYSFCVNLCEEPYIKDVIFSSIVK